MSDDVIIREVQPEDIPTIETIAAKAWEGYFQMCRDRLGQRIYDVVHRGWETWKPEQVAKQCRAAHGEHVLVAEADGHVAGFVVYYLDVGRTGIGEISNNAVSPDYQGRGIATQLCTEVLERMRQAGMKVAKVFAGLDDTHIPARRAYEKLGFSRNLQSVEYYRML